MTQREQKMLRVLLGLLGFVVVAGLFFYLVLRPLNALAQQEEAVAASLTKKAEVVRALNRDKKRLDMAKERSLPLQPHSAAIGYGSYLRGAIEDAKLEDVIFQGPGNLDSKPVTAVGPKAKKTTQTVLTFTVRAKGTFEQVVRAIETMQNTPVMHRVKRLSLDRIDVKDPKGKLAMHMEVEALILHGIPFNHRPSLTPTSDMDPPGTHPKRQYAMLGKRNFFLGYVSPAPTRVVSKNGDPEPEIEPDVDARRFVRLDHTIPSSNEAYIRDLLTGEAPIRIRPTPGFNTIKVWTEDRRRLLVTGKVIRVDQRDVYFSVGTYVYGWHIGHSIWDAMQRGRLSREDQRELGLLPSAPASVPVAATEPEEPETALANGSIAADVKGGEADMNAAPPAAAKPVEMDLDELMLGELKSGASEPGASAPGEARPGALKPAEPGIEVDLADEAALASVKGIETDLESEPPAAVKPAKMDLDDLSRGEAKSGAIEAGTAEAGVSREELVNPGKLKLGEPTNGAEEPSPRGPDEQAGGVRRF